MEKKINFEDQPVRVITDSQEQIWFAGIDICNILGYAMPSNVIKENLDDDEKKLTNLTDGSGQLRKTWIINEFGFYNLVLSSSKPEAKAFKKWVCHEILPAIRKAGKFTTEEEKIHDLEVRQLAKEIFELKKKKSVLSHDIAVIKKALSEKEYDLMLSINLDRQQLKLNL